MNGSEGILISLILGGLAGWLGSILFKGSGLGLLGNIVVGILGGVFGYWLFPKLGLPVGKGTVGYIITAALGALILLAILNLIFRKK